MEKKENIYIRFDWAMKRLLRNKANFDVLEGFLTTLLGESIKINNLLESENNGEYEDNKSNRMDLLAENSKGELIIIEVQNNTEYVYFQRILFGTSNLLTEYINRGCRDKNVKKVYCVNIMFFNLRSGCDTIYHGKTEFRGVRFGDILKLTPFHRQNFNISSDSDLYPEYYILKVNNFNGVVKSPLDEWISYLKYSEIPDETSAPGLDKVRERLKLDTMTKAELKTYDRYIDNLVILRDNIYTAREGGLAEGLEQGRAEGEKAKALEMARLLKQAGVDSSIIEKSSGLSSEEIENL